MLIIFILASCFLFKTKRVYSGLIIINHAQTLYLDHLLTTSLNLI